MGARYPEPGTSSGKRPDNRKTIDAAGALKIAMPEALRWDSAAKLYLLECERDIRSEEIARMHPCTGFLPEQWMNSPEVYKRCMDVLKDEYNRTDHPGGIRRLALKVNRYRQKGQWVPMPVWQMNYAVDDNLRAVAIHSVHGRILKKK